MERYGGYLKQHQPNRAPNPVTQWSSSNILHV